MALFIQLDKQYRFYLILFYYILLLNFAIFIRYFLSSTFLKVSQV